MKKILSIPVVCAVLLILSVIPAWAAGTEKSGFYNIGTAQNVEIVPLSAAGEAVQAVYQNVDDAAGDEELYPGSSALRIALHGTAEGRLYILTLSDEEVIYYANQQSGGGTLTFYVAFELPNQRTDMTLNVGSNEEGFAKLSIPLSYTPAAAPKMEDETTPLPPSPPPVPTTEVTPTGNDYAECRRDVYCPMAAYYDLNRDAWYHDGVHWALEKKIMNGYGEGKFEPNDTTSRAMIVTMLHRMEGSPIVKYDMAFNDVEEGKWYTEAIRWAAANGIVEGYSKEKYEPTDELTREQLATILYRYVRIRGLGFTDTWVSLLTYDDASDVSGWANEAMCWMTMQGVIQGTGSNKLSPKGSATRAQVATMLMRCKIVA